jgi:hypothetical protein
MSQPEIEMAYPLRWVEGRPRTPPPDRKYALWRNDGRRLTLTVARQRLRDQIAAMSHAHLARGRVWCRRCQRSEPVDPAQSMRQGWPRCCGATMTIDSPQEQRALARRPWVPAEMEPA